MRNQFFGANVSRGRDLDATDPQFVTRLDLVAYIYLGSRIVADQHNSQSRSPLLCREIGDTWPQFVQNFLVYFLAVEDNPAHALVSIAGRLLTASVFAVRQC